MPERTVSADRFLAAALGCAASFDKDDGAIGQFYLENGNTVIIEKAPGDKVTCATSNASAVGSPRS